MTGQPPRPTTAAAARCRGPVRAIRARRVIVPTAVDLGAVLAVATAGAAFTSTQNNGASAAAAWLCSDHASFITGATIPIDGGIPAATR